MILTAVGLMTSCSGGSDTVAHTSDQPSDTIPVDTIPAIPQPMPGDSTYHFAGSRDIVNYLDTCRDSEKYKGGVVYTMAVDAPEYADKLIAEMAKYDKFIVVDKASMQVILYDRYGQVMKSYPMACARNYGTKHRRADSRTPEGFFSLEGKYNSTDWLFTNDWGHTSSTRGQFGPRFLRVKHPNTRQIGIHGTGSPGSLGHRVSHGCIRIANANILELHDLVEPGIPIIILPGPKDREVNRREGYDIPFFATSEKYAMTAEEKALPVNPEKVKEDFVSVPARSGAVEADDEDVESADAATENVTGADSPSDEPAATPDVNTSPENTPATAPVTAPEPVSTPQPAQAE